VVGEVVVLGKGEGVRGTREKDNCRQQKNNKLECCVSTGLQLADGSLKIGER